MDFSWENKEGQNCYSLVESDSCDDEKFKGFSSNEACCHCGGGHRTATPFTYFVGATVVGATEIVGHPVPRTASKYSVDKDCELAKYGLTIEASTGQLAFTSSCSVVGCGTITEAFSVSCTITAEQDGSYLTTSALLTVNAQLGLSYGNAPVVFMDDPSVKTTYSPALTAALAASSPTFQLACSPSDASNQFELGAEGELTAKSDANVAGGVTGVQEVGYVTAQSATDSFTAPVVILMPEIWSQLDYGFETLYVTLGERSPLLKPIVEDGKLPPSRFSAYVADDAFSFDVLTGAGSYMGHLLFHLDVTTGYFRPLGSLTELITSSWTL
ncbi:unnamed protein product [Durusdinium trenchii]|uniref:Uncharacterized protein n=1 Tax=Durusdinium trenchii TaxID=1381693 RepID=A0ABP0Q4D6_9DINO